MAGVAESKLPRKTCCSSSVARAGDERKKLTGRCEARGKCPKTGRPRREGDRRGEAEEEGGGRCKLPADGGYQGWRAARVPRPCCCCYPRLIRAALSPPRTQACLPTCFELSRFWYIHPSAASLDPGSEAAARRAPVFEPAHQAQGAGVPIGASGDAAGGCGGPGEGVGPGPEPAPEGEGVGRRVGGGGVGNMPGGGSGMPGMGIPGRQPGGGAGKPGGGRKPPGGMGGWLNGRVKGATGSAQVEWQETCAKGEPCPCREEAACPCPAAACR